jgi:hypothetical protein
MIRPACHARFAGSLICSTDAIVARSAASASPQSHGGHCLPAVDGSWRPDLSFLLLIGLTNTA